MKFIVDECTGPAVAMWLRGRGHEIFSIYDEARGSSDELIIRKASAEDWIIITNDKDFGDKVFRDKSCHRGIIILRLDDERSVVKIDVLSKLMAQYPDRLTDQFIVVTEKQIRFAKR